jgi:hypothetical protein
MFELRAMTARCRLLQLRGRLTEARGRLAAICNRFTEGLETPHVREARRLLEAWASESDH